MRYQIQMMDKRTPTQNNSLHLLYTHTAKAMNEEGVTLNKVVESMRSGVELSMTPELVKEAIWKPIQEALTAKRSTTQLDKQKEIDIVYEVFNKFTARFGIHIPFPSQDETEIK